MSDTIEIKVEDIRKGDRFVADGRVAWTALDHAMLTTSRTGPPLIVVTVQHADGGRDERAWEPGARIEVER